MPNYSYPNADIDTSNWVSPPLWSEIDEGDPPSDADIIQSADNDLFEFDCEVSMQDLQDPGIDTGHEIQVRACRAGTTGIQLKAELLQSSVVKATFTDIAVANSGVFGDFVLALSSGEVASLTTSTGFFRNLSIRLTAVHPTFGFPDRVQVSRLRLKNDLGFAHLDISAGGLLVASANSGNYLVLDAGGYRRVAGAEVPGGGALILNGSGQVVVG